MRVIGSLGTLTEMFEANWKLWHWWKALGRTKPFGNGEKLGNSGKALKWAENLGPTEHFGTIESFRANTNLSDFTLKAFSLANGNFATNGNALEESVGFGTTPHNIAFDWLLWLKHVFLTLEAFQLIRTCICYKTASNRLWNTLGLFDYQTFI